MYFLAEFQEASIFKDMIRTLLASLCDIVYRGIILFYQLFMAIGDATILNSVDIQKIFNRIGLILGIIMMFRLIFSFVQYILDPDKITDKETGVGGLIKKVIVVILALGLVNWVFEEAIKLQGIILEENVIGKIVLGVGSDEEIDMKEFGTMLSYTLFSNFYYQNPEMNEDALKDANSKGCGPDYFNPENGEFKRYISTFYDFEAVHKCVNEEGTAKANLFGNKIYYATFHGLEALIVGGFVLWILIMYTISLGVRVVKLAFLRIVSPVPILSYLSPKKSNSFSNWIKQCVMTYLDLFIRIAIIYFAMLLISIIFTRGATVGTSFAVDDSDQLLFIGLDKWFNIILVLGVLLFAKKIPDLLADLFPGMGGKGGLDLGFGLKSRTDFAGKGLVTRTAGAAIGAGAIGALGLLQGANRRINPFTTDANGNMLEKTKGQKVGERVRNTFSGFGMGVARGAWNGAHGGKISDNIKKGFNKQVASSMEANTFSARGGENYTSRFAYGLARQFGLPTAFEMMSEELDRNKKMAELGKQTSSQLGSNADSMESSTNRFKDKLASNDTNVKTPVDSGKMQAAIQYLSDAGIFAFDKNTNQWRLNYGTKNNPIYGEAVDGMQFGVIDDKFKKEHQGVTEEISRLREEKGKLVDRQSRYNSLKAQLDIASKEYERLDALNIKSGSEEERQFGIASQRVEYYKNELKALNFDEVGTAEMIKDLDARIKENVERQEAINVTKVEKKVAEAMDIEMMRGNYEDPVAREGYNTAKSELRANIKTIELEGSQLSASIDNSNKIAASEYKVAASVLTNMLDKLDHVDSDTTLSSLFTGIDDKNNEENWYTMNRDNDGKLVSVSIPIVNFDAAKNENGTHPNKTIEISNLFQLKDELTSYLRNFQRGKNEQGRQLDAKIQDREHDVAYLQAKLLDEFVKNK